jgi:hypothetical protein
LLVDYALWRGALRCPGYMGWVGLMLTGFWFEKEVLKFEPMLRVRVGVVSMAYSGSHLFSMAIWYVSHSLVIFVIRLTIAGDSGTDLCTL